MFTFYRLGLCQKESRRNAIPVPSVLLETLTHRLSSRDGARDASDDSAGVSVAAHDFQVFNTTELTAVDGEGWMKGENKREPACDAASLDFPAGFRSKQLAAIWVHLAKLGAAPGSARAKKRFQLFTSNILTPNHMRNRSGLGKSAFLSAHVLVSQRDGDITRFAFLREELYSCPSLPTAARRPPVRSRCRPSAHPCGGQIHLLTEQQAPCDG